MKILIVTQIYRPEMGALANRIYPIVRRLTEAGHEVSVATGMPNYPEGVTFPEYRGKFTSKEELDGCTVHRTACYTTPRNRNRWAQLGSYLSFIPAAFHSGWCAGKVDVVFVTSPPLFAALPALWLARLAGAKLVLDLRDLWPDEIVACGGAAPGSLPVRLMQAIERAAYRSADLVTCTTEAFMETVERRGVPRGKLMRLPNGADLELFRPFPPDNPVAAAEGFGAKFVVMYSGLLGIKHGLDTIMEAARLLRDETNIQFYFVGNGARRVSLQQQAQAQGLENVVFAGERPVTEIPHLLARADLCLSALLPDPYLEKIITVKLFEYLACGKPVVASQAGEGARVVRDSGGGLVVPPGDARALADAILALYRNPERRAAMGSAGQRYVEENYSRAAWAERLEARLCQLSDAEPVSVPRVGGPRPAAVGRRGFFWRGRRRG